MKYHRPCVVVYQTIDFRGIIMAFSDRLIQARCRRGFFKADLAKAARLSVRSVAAFETGKCLPSAKTRWLLSAALGFSEAFFLHGKAATIPEETISFRALSSISATQKRAAISAHSFSVEIARWIESQFAFPKVQVPELSGQTPEDAAERLRELWSLGVQAIDNTIALLESKGVRVFSLAEDCREIDTCSVWVDETPFLFLNTFKSAERIRLDVVHELGHLVLHQKIKVQGKMREREADRFALAFLIPKQGILAEPPPTMHMETLIEFKKKWRVSLIALAHRLHTLKLMTDWNHKKLCIRISKLGYKIQEPNEIIQDESVVLKQAFRVLRENGWTIERISEATHIPANEIKSLTFGGFVLG